MKRIPAAALLLIAIPLSAAQHVRAVEPPVAVPQPSSVLWIGAHPDDEAVAAPLLAEWCGESKAHCTFLIVTRGEKGTCSLAGGCLPDMASVRASEAGASSEYFGADAILLRWPDGGGASLPDWAAQPDRAATIAAYIEAVRPALILTFDPRHGTTCHPDHRAVGQLVIDAMARLSYRPELDLLETRVSLTSDASTIDFTSAGGTSARFDANQFLQAYQTDAWDAVIEDMKRNPSQFDESWLDAIRTIPASRRAVFIAPAATVLDEPVSTCP